MYIMCVILFLFSALSRRVSALQMSIIIIIVIIIIIIIVVVAAAAVAVVVRRRRSKPRKKCHKKAENYDNSVMRVKTEKVPQHSASLSLERLFGTRYAYPGVPAAARTHSYRCVQYCRVSRQCYGC